MLHFHQLFHCLPFPAVGHTCGSLNFYRIADQFLNVCSAEWRPPSITELTSMTRRDQALLDKQLRWLDHSPAYKVLALSVLTTILFCVLLGGATIG